MADVLSRGTLFPQELVTDLISTVKGKSSLAKLSTAKPVAFNGNKEFIFTLDKEVDIVAENGAKGKGGITVDPVTIIPIKIEYGARVSDEFKYGSEEVKLNYLEQFIDGFAKKVARGIDIAAFHGLNPRSKTASTVVGNNNFLSKVTQVVEMGTGTVDDNVETAIEMVSGSEFDVTGMAMAPAFKSALAKLKNSNGEKLYPQLSWGSTPSEINGLTVDSNSTVSFNQSPLRAIVGDFENMFKWGYASEIMYEMIEYGNPDNDATLGDLKGHNQVYLRAEVFVGWGILAPEAFALIQEKTEDKE